MRMGVDGEIVAAGRKGLPTRRSVAPQWQRYELEKANWIARHPDATSAEYETAIRAISKRLGV